MTSTYESPLLTISEAAKYLKISRTSMYRLLQSRKVPTVKLLTRGQFVEKDALDLLISPSKMTSASTSITNNE